jgi:hypothetical protein
MRALIFASALASGGVYGCVAMAVASSSSQAIRVHGCHSQYGHEGSRGWLLTTSNVGRSGDWWSARVGLLTKADENST